MTTDPYRLEFERIAKRVQQENELANRQAKGIAMPTTDVMQNQQQISPVTEFARSAFKSFASVPVGAVGLISPDTGQSIQESIDRTIPTSGEGWASELGQALGQAPYAIGALATGPAGIAAMGGLYGASAAGQNRMNIAEFEERTGQDVSATKEVLTSLGYGGAEFLGEVAGLHALRGVTKMIPGSVMERFGAYLLKGDSERAAKTLVRGVQIAGGALTGSSSEAATQVMQNAIERYGYNPDRTLSQGVWQAARIGALGDVMAQAGTMAMGGAPLPQVQQPQLPQTPFEEDSWSYGFEPEAQYTSSELRSRDELEFPTSEPETQYTTAQLAPRAPIKELEPLGVSPNIRSFNEFMQRGAPGSEQMYRQLARSAQLGAYQQPMDTQRADTAARQQQLQQEVSALQAQRQAAQEVTASPNDKRVDAVVKSFRGSNKPVPAGYVKAMFGVTSKEAQAIADEANRRIAEDPNSRQRLDRQRIIDNVIRNMRFAPDIQRLVDIGLTPDKIMQVIEANGIADAIRKTGIDPRTGVIYLSQRNQYQDVAPNYGRQLPLGLPAPQAQPQPPMLGQAPTQPPQLGLAMQPPRQPRAVSQALPAPGREPISNVPRGRIRVAPENMPAFLGIPAPGAPQAASTPPARDVVRSMQTANMQRPSEEKILGSWQAQQQQQPVSEEAITPDTSEPNYYYAKSGAPFKTKAATGKTKAALKAAGIETEAIKIAEGWVLREVAAQQPEVAIQPEAPETAPVPTEPRKIKVKGVRRPFAKTTRSEEVTEDDTQDEGRMGSDEREGEAPQPPIQEPSGSRATPEASRVLQAQEVTSSGVRSKGIVKYPKLDWLTPEREAAIRRVDIKEFGFNEARVKAVEPTRGMTLQDLYFAVTRNVLGVPIPIKNMYEFLQRPTRTSKHAPRKAATSKASLDEEIKTYLDAGIARLENDELIFDQFPEPYVNEEQRQLQREREARIAHEAEVAEKKRVASGGKPTELSQDVFETQVRVPYNRVIGVTTDESGERQFVYETDYTTVDMATLPEPKEVGLPNLENVPTGEDPQAEDRIDLAIEGLRRNGWEQAEIDQLIEELFREDLTNTQLAQELETALSRSTGIDVRLKGLEDYQPDKSLKLYERYQRALGALRARAWTEDELATEYAERLEAGDTNAEIVEWFEGYLTVNVEAAGGYGAIAADAIKKYRVFDPDDAEFQRKTGTDAQTFRNQETQRLLTQHFIQTGLFANVVYSPVQLTDGQGNPVNGAMMGDGTLMLSPGVPMNTVGHEAFHALVRRLGMEDPMIQQGLKLFDYNVEALADAVGDVYASRVMPSGLRGRLVNWLRRLWSYATYRLGVGVTRQDIAQRLSSRMEQFQANDVPKVPLNDLAEFQRGERMFSGLSKDELAEAALMLVRDTYGTLPKKTLKNMGIEGLEELQKPGAIKKLTSRIRRGVTRPEDQVMAMLLDQGYGLAFKRDLDALSDLYKEGTKQFEEAAERLYKEFYKKSMPLVRASQLSGQVLASRKAVKMLSAKQLLGLPKELRDQYEEILTSGNAEELQQFVQQNRDKPKFKDYMLEVYYNAMLSNPGTHVRNSVGNTLWFTWQFPHRALVGGLDALLHGIRLKKGERSYYVSEVLPMLTGAITEVPAAAKRARRAFKRGIAPAGFETKFQQDIVTGAQNAFARSSNPIARAAAPLITFPGRALLAMDVFSSTLAFNAELSAIGFRDAWNNGLQGKDAELHAADVVADPSQEQRRRALRFARYATFTDSPGRMLGNLIRARDALPFGVGRLVVPFMVTLTNILKRGAEMTPGIGLISPAVRAAEGKATYNMVVQTVAKQTEGAVLTLALAAMLDYDDDKLTGNVPRGVPQREAFYRQGKQPFSVRVGDRWYSYQDVAPFNIIFGAVASLRDAIHNGDDEVTVQEKFAQTVDTMVNYMLGATWYQNFSQTIGAPSGIQQTAERLPANMVPYSNFWRSILRAAESEDGEFALKEGSGIMYELAQVLPLPQDYPKRRNVWGEEVTIPGSIPRQWLPFRYTQASVDETEVRLEALQRATGKGYIGMPSKTLKVGNTEVEMDDKFYQDFVLFQGTLLKMALDRVVKSQQWNSWNDTVRLRVVNRIASRVHDRARKVAVAMYRQQQGLGRYEFPRTQIPRGYQQAL
jgi:hypothetical protein